MWPLNAKFLDAYVRNLRAYVSSPHLCDYEVNFLLGGEVDAHASAYARAYRVKGTNGSFACLRFWMNTVPASILETYAELERTPEVLRRCGLSQVKLLNEAIVIDGQAIPAVLMDWVDGRSLSDIVTMHLNDRSKLLQIAEKLRSTFASLNEHRTSHGDLRSSNILITIEQKLVRVSLIDLDSMRWQGGPEAPRVMGGSGIWHEIWQRENISPLESDYLDQAATYLTVVAVATEKSWWGGSTDGFLFRHLGVDLREVIGRVEQMSGTPAARVASAVKRAIEVPGHWNEVADVMRNPMGGPLTAATFWNVAIERKVSRTEPTPKAPATPPSKIASKTESKKTTRHARKAPAQAPIQTPIKAPIPPVNRMAPWLWILVLVMIGVIAGIVFRKEISVFLAGLELFR